MSLPAFPKRVPNSQAAIRPKRTTIPHTSDEIILQQMIENNYRSINDRFSSIYRPNLYTIDKSNKMDGSKQSSSNDQSINFNKVPELSKASKSQQRLNAAEKISTIFSAQKLTRSAADRTNVIEPPVIRWSPLGSHVMSATVSSSTEFSVSLSTSTAYASIRNVLAFSATLQISRLDQNLLLNRDAKQALMLAAAVAMQVPDDSLHVVAASRRRLLDNWQSVVGQSSHIAAPAAVASEHQRHADASTTWTTTTFAVDDSINISIADVIIDGHCIVPTGKMSNLQFIGNGEYRIVIEDLSTSF